DGVLERAERQHARDRAVPVLSRVPESPVVDGKAATRPRRGEDAEAAHDRLDRVAEAELGTVVDLRRVADGEHIARVGHQLAAEAEHEPNRMDVTRSAVEPLRAREVRETGDRSQREQSRQDEY